MSAHVSSAAALGAINRRGIAAMVFSAISFVTNDALIKYASESVGGTQAIFVRGLFGTVFLLILAHALGATRQWRRLADKRTLARSSLDAASTMFYLTALFHLPIGNATAINMATPLFITLFAVVLLRERPQAARWIALGCGFAGVLLIVQPAASGFNAWALLCVTGTLMGSGRDLVTRFIDRSIPSSLLTFSAALVVTLFSGTLMLFQPWQPIGTTQFGLLALAALLLGNAHYFLIYSMRAGEMSLIAPFRYSGLLAALVIGYTVWGDVPNTVAFAGIALLVSAGLYMLHTERTRQREMMKAVID